MSWKGFFEGIQEFAEGVLFVPYDALRTLELESWWSANIMTWVFTLIGFVAFTYWMLELKKFNDNNEEDRSQISHSFLGND
ncbi:MAG: uracil phosphoribosyltransferase [Bacteroidota bacterium]